MLEEQSFGTQSVLGPSFVPKSMSKIMNGERDKVEDESRMQLTAEPSKALSAEDETRRESGVVEKAQKDVGRVAIGTTERRSFE